ncbi:MAG: hypothetical protein DI598_07265 [Pseudopedobacter saltans]|uniref:Uncharacterized protein n=1 Tax=Pseudopedobacter saltans TaxID=151895 RepID=A0A2W5H1Z2_9SPHI|nr:MAG: hypothetical protein DI598_07265 [Pseudopedobacter saltans]
MKNIGSFVKRHGIKPTVSLLYIVPAVLLFVGIVMVFISMFKAPPTERTFHWVGIGILLLMIIILLIARVAALPKYFFEMYENGIKIIYKKDKTPNEEYCFDEISEIWHLAIDGGNKTTNLVFKPSDVDYKLISSKISDCKGLFRNLTEAVVKQLLPSKSAALTHGERLVFPILVSGGEQVMTSEKAILPYFKQAKKEHLSLDRFSVFDGQKTYALADVSEVVMDQPSVNILINSIVGSTLYTQSYFSIGNADLFMALMKDVVVGDKSSS